LYRHDQPDRVLRFTIERIEAMGNLLHYAVVFLVIAIVAAIFGFGGVAGTAMGGAQILFWVAIILFVLSSVIGLIKRA